MSERLRRRTWPLVYTVIFVSLGTVYFFRWGSVVQHVPSTWLSADDLWATYSASIAFIHGRFSDVYSTSTGFLAFPGILIVLAPVAALDRSLHTTLILVEKGHHIVANPATFAFSGPVTPHGALLNLGQNHYAAHPQVLLLLGPYSLLLSCVALFACDALAERLGVSGTRRALLGLAEAAILWNVAVRWGHPQDAVALALALYALIFAIDERWSAAGWLFGLGLAFQPLVIVVLPILVAMGGKRRALAMVVRGVVPAAVVTIPPLAGDFHTTFHALTSQPAYPGRNHATPWTTFAPKLGGKGKLKAVGGGPVRILSLALAVALGWWTRRWRSQPEMLAWAVALALALRCYTESVMTSYYVWPTLAVGLVVAARCSPWRFRLVIAAAIFTTISAQWHLGEFPWWAIDMAGLTVVLATSARPEATPEFEAVLTPERVRPQPSPAAARSASAAAAAAAAKKKSRKAARTNRKRSARR
jgi:hypothetical protein